MTTHPNHFLLKDRLAASMHRCGHAFRTAINLSLAPFNLTHLQWAVLQLIIHNEGQRQTELAESLGIESPSLVRVLDGLERDGWVERRACTDDRRAKRVFLKTDCAGRLEGAMDAIRSTHERAVSGLSVEQRAELVTLIDSMSSSLLTHK